MKAHAALAAVLTRLELNTMFGVLGDGNMYLAESYAEHGGRYVAAANEAGAVGMALGYATATRGVGLATVTFGPGLANTLGALTVAAREHAPVVVVTGDISVPGHTQNIDQSALVAPTGAGYERAARPETALADLVQTVRTALVERRPMVFAVPAEFTFVDVEADVASSIGVPGDYRILPDLAVMDRAVGAIASAKRPIVLAGHGAGAANAARAAARLAERLGALTATTLPAKGMFAGNKHDLGVFGSFSTERAIGAIEASDCIIALGTSMSRLTGGGDGWPYFQERAVVQCDIDYRAIGANFDPTVGVVADVESFCETVIEWLDEAAVEPTTFRDQEYVREQAYAVSQEQPASQGERHPDNGVGLEAAMTALNTALPWERSICVDGGRFASAGVQLLDAPATGAWAYPGRGLGSIGNGLTTAIGMACAKPGRPAVAVVGDGAFMLGGLAEFNTAVRAGLDLIVAVFNDGCYGAEFRKLRGHGFGVERSLFDWPDFASVAQSLGGDGHTFATGGALATLPELLRDRPGSRPVLLDFKLDPAAIRG